MQLFHFLIIFHLCFAQCKFDYDCGSNGVCKTVAFNTTNCICNHGYITVENYSVCGYKQKTKLELFLESFFVGSLGVDWFVLANVNGYNPVYAVAGSFKLLTLGGIGIWWLVDWIRILCNSFNDGQGQPLADWS